MAIPSEVKPHFSLLVSGCHSLKVASQVLFWNYFAKLENLVEFTCGEYYLNTLTFELFDNHCALNGQEAL